MSHMGKATHGHFGAERNVDQAPVEKQTTFTAKRPMCSFPGPGFLAIAQEGRGSSFFEYLFLGGFKGKPRGKPPFGGNHYKNGHA